MFRLFDSNDGASNADIHLLVLEPGSPSGPYHYHAKSENFYYMLEGQIRLVVEGKDYIVSASEAAFVPAGLKHRVEHIGSTPAKLIEVWAPGGPDRHLVEEEKS